MRIKKYLTLTRAGIMEMFFFRASIMVSFAGNLIYLTIIYFLWKAIYDSSPTDVVNGMTFTDTMVYLVLATALFNFMEVYLVWQMGRDIQSGTIVLDILKPIGYQRLMFFKSSGNYIVSFLLTLIPTGIIVYFITGGAIHLGINLIFFFVAMIFGLIINYYINFFTGTICLYTESNWGVNIMKEIIVLLCSGASIPIAFFPEPIKNIIYKLPFQAIYNTPLQLLIDEKMSIIESLEMIVVQIFWLIVVLGISKIFWHISLKKITVNGG